MTAPSAALASACPAPVDSAEQVGVEAPTLPWHQRLQNRVRMAILNWLGVTPTLIELGRRVHGNRSDIEIIAGNTQGMLTSLNACIAATNRNTHMVGVYQQYPMLGKLAAEDRAREAAKRKEVLTNGDDMSHIVDISGKPITPENN